MPPRPRAPLRLLRAVHPHPSQKGKSQKNSIEGAIGGPEIGEPGRGGRATATNAPRRTRRELPDLDSLVSQKILTEAPGSTPRRSRALVLTSREVPPSIRRRVEALPPKVWEEAPRSVSSRKTGAREPSPVPMFPRQVFRQIKGPPAKGLRHAKVGEKTSTTTILGTERSPTASTARKREITSTVGAHKTARNSNSPSRVPSRPLPRRTSLLLTLTSRKVAKTALAKWSRRRSRTRKMISTPASVVLCLRRIVLDAMMKCRSVLRRYHNCPPFRKNW